jgi:tetratricopeptide (TPR) repeat protein
LITEAPLDWYGLLARRSLGLAPLKGAVVAANAIAAMRAQIQAQHGKAQGYYDAAKADFDAGRFIKADSNIYLALKIAPQNPVYLELQRATQEKARGQRADQHIVVAEQADQYGRGKEAITALEQAVACDPPDGKAFFMLARARKASGESAAPKDLLPLYKKAAARSPKVFEYRMAAAEIYEAMGMTANAHREATAAVELNPKSEAAKQLQRRTRP